MPPFRLTFEIGLNIALVVLLLTDLIINIYRWGKRNSAVDFGKLTIEVAHTTKIEFQDAKVATTSADVVREVTACLEAITIDKKKFTLLEISNEPGGEGFIVRTKFGSS